MHLTVGLIHALPVNERRVLSRDEAASYVGVSPGHFAKLVRNGTMPAPLPAYGRIRRWDKASLDRALDGSIGAMAQVHPRPAPTTIGRPRMVRANLKGINTVKKRLKDGTVKVHHYHRATGRPLRGAPGSAEFLNDYALAEQSQVEKRQGTLGGLIRDFTLSPEFSKRAESTQREYRRMLGKVEEKFGTMPIAALEDKRVRGDFMDWRDEVMTISGPREADNRISVLSALLSWAVDRTRIGQNHASGIARLHKADRSDKLWLPEHIEAFMNVASVEMQRALILALHTGQRQGDLRKLAWSNYDGVGISIRQSKGGRAVYVPCTPALKDMLDSMDRNAAVIMSTKTGRAWQKRYFAEQWDEASKAAGITDLHFHDLRGTAVTMLAEAGCSVPEIASITGHSLKSVHTILEKYMSRTKALAKSAMTKFENASSTVLQTEDRRKALNDI